MIETDLMKLFQYECGQRLSFVRLFRRNIVNARTAGGWHAKAGIKGQCDLHAYVKGGYSIEIETKARRGKLSPHQEAWRDWCKEWGVPWIQLKEVNGDSPELTVVRWVEQVRVMALSIRRAF